MEGKQFKTQTRFIKIITNIQKIRNKQNKT